MSISKINKKTSFNLIKMAENKSSSNDNVQSIFFELNDKTVAEELKKDLIAKAVKKGDITIFKAVVMLDAAPAKDLVFKIREAIPEKLICVVGATSQGRPSLNVMLSDDMVAEGLNAGKLVREAARLIQGGGGGQPHFAQAGGKNVDGIKAAVDKVVELIKE